VRARPYTIVPSAYTQAPTSADVGAAVRAAIKMKWSKVPEAATNELVAAGITVER